MNNVSTFNGMNPLTLRIQGSGEYVKEQCAGLADLFDYAEWNHLQELRYDNE